nr:RNA-directed DNA polymerase, eukaryota, reverse transcriptase zinc-binding domain protein [Tanacetum cinerariifolium]
EKEGGKHKNYSNAPSKDNGFMAKSNSFAQVMKGGSMSGNMECGSIPAMVLDDDNVGAGSWFSVLQQAEYDFTVEGRIVWVEVEEVDDQEESCFHSRRLCIYTKSHSNIFDSFKIAFRGKVYWIRAKEVPGWIPEIMEVSDDDEQSVEDDNGGDIVVHEVGNHGEDSDVDEVSEMMFDESSGQKKKQYEDPFGIYSLLDKQRKVNSHGDTVNGESLKYLPGFTPINATEMMGQSNKNVEKQNGDRDQYNNGEEPLNGRDDYSDNMGAKPDDLDWGCSGRFKKSVAPRTGGSILCLMEEVVKVGQTIGEVMMMGDFNEVRFKSDRFGSFFNEHGADMFNSFISNASLEEVPLGGCAYTWCHKSASKMNLVKDEFVQHFSSRFGKPTDIRASIDMNFPKVLSSVQKEELKCDVSKEELKQAVWDCGMDKSLGPDGFTFGFFCKFWSTIENDVYEAVTYFFTNGVIPKGCNSSFIALIPKTPGANIVKDFRPISLIGCMYKIIAKILTNRLVGAIGDIVNEIQSAFIADRKILDGPFILNEVMHWCTVKKKQALIFKVDFEKANDSVRWDFLDEVLQKINMCKSKIMGVHVEGDLVKHATSKLGCLILNTPFVYLGMKVGGKMSRVKEWNEVVDKVVSRLSRWKMKTLSIGGRLTLLKSVLGSILIFHMSIYRVPSRVLQQLESIRNRFFNGNDNKKATWIKWSNVLADKAKWRLGVSTLYALNRGLMIKWL